MSNMLFNIEKFIIYNIFLGNSFIYVYMYMYIDFFLILNKNINIFFSKNKTKCNYFFS